MLNRTKYFRKLCLSGSFLVGLISLSSTANAQFIGINVDYGIDYSAAPGKVNGFSVGISHPAPFIPNIGYSSVSFSEEEDKTVGNYKLSLVTTTTITTYNLFYNVPFPLVTITVGFGGGSQNLGTGVETITTIDQVESNLETSVSEAFFHIGLSFWNTIEFHLGYHFMSFSSIDITKSDKFQGKYPTVKKSYSGGMTTIGVQVAF